MGWWNSKKTYESGKTPKYAVGQVLYLYEPWTTEDGWIFKRASNQCEITEVSKKKKGLIYKEFVYKVRFLNSGRKFKNIYESQLSETKHGTQYTDIENGAFPINDDEDK